MTDETTLTPCPKCGKQPRRYTGKRGLDEDSYYVMYECLGDDHLVRAIGDNDLEAIEAWNTRYEPTCHNFGGEEGTNGEGYDFACSACGYLSDITEPIYCPNCGAKVVE